MKIICSGENELNIERSISGTNVPRGHEHHVNQCPHSQPSETKQLANTLLPVTKIESVSSEPSQADGEEERGVPAVPLRPVTLSPLAEDMFTQTQRVLLHTAISNIPVS